jgi:hypothetical protein
VLVAPWLITNWSAVVRYAEWGVGFGRGQEPWSDPGRWVYHLRAMVNNGFGLIPSGVLLALAAARPALRSASGCDLRVPLAQVGVSYPILAIFQPSVESQFILSWMPALAIAVAELARRCSARARRTGRVATLLLTAGALLNVILVQRGVYEDRAGPVVLGIELPPKTDHYLTGKVAPWGVIASPHPESWPIAEFTDAILSRPLGHPAVVLDSHQFVNPANLRCAGLLRGADIRGRVLRLDAEAWAIDALASDYLVHDDLYGALPAHLAYLTRSGIGAEIVIRTPVIGERCVTLVRVLAR